MSAIFTCMRAVHTWHACCPNCVDSCEVGAQCAPPCFVLLLPPWILVPCCGPAFLLAPYPGLSRLPTLVEALERAVSIQTTVSPPNAAKNVPFQPLLPSGMPCMVRRCRSLQAPCLRTATLLCVLCTCIVCMCTVTMCVHRRELTAPGAAGRHWGKQSNSSAAKVYVAEAATPQQHHSD
jgi:hypothetical protein